MAKTLTIRSCFYQSPKAQKFRGKFYNKDENAVPESARVDSSHETNIYYINGRALEVLAAVFLMHEGSQYFDDDGACYQCEVNEYRIVLTSSVHRDGTCFINVEEYEILDEAGLLDMPIQVL